VLVIGLQGDLPAEIEDLRGRAVLVLLRGPVVIDLMVVPGAEPGGGGVAGLQVRVHLVLGVAAPVVIQRIDLSAQVRPGSARPGRGRCAAALVDVVAIAIDEVEVLLGDLPVRRVQALLVGLAADDAKARP
jgi:hypothetical protein